MNKSSSIAQAGPGDKSRSRRQKMSVYGRFVKRPLDIALVVAALPVLAPAMLAITVAIMASGKGPVILRVSRKGKNGKIFKQLRFRCLDMAALDRKDLPATTASGRDARLTAIGDLLLRTRLNALPQIWNVLTGEMAMIGPLPEPVRVDRQIERNAMLRRVAPGIFCPSELPDYRGLSGKDRKAVAIAYANNVTFAMDLKVAASAFYELLKPTARR